MLLQRPKKCPRRLLRLSCVCFCNCFVANNTFLYAAVGISECLSFQCMCASLCTVCALSVYLYPPSVCIPLYIVCVCIPVCCLGVLQCDDCVFLLVLSVCITIPYVYVYLCAVCESLCVLSVYSVRLLVPT